MSRQFKLLLVFSALLLTGFTTAKAQNTSTQGKEFWLTFLHNGNYDLNEGGKMQISVSARRTCSGTITNLNTNWSIPFTVEANSINNIEIPAEQCYHDGNNFETVSNKGIKILSTDTISVYCANIAGSSFEASFTLPTESLGEDYIIQTSEQSISDTENDVPAQNETSAFAVIATEDNTVVDITPRVNTLGGHTAGTTFSVTLNAGQTYQVRSNNTATQSSLRDLSGTRVTAQDCKKIAVINGNTLTRLPIDDSYDSGFNHVFEQALPLRSWGKKFVVTQSISRTHDIVKIISSTNNNTIRKNGQAIATLNQYETYRFTIDNNHPSCFIDADMPCAVYSYDCSAYDNKGSGAPTMVWIAPIEQRINDVTFTTFNDDMESIDHHYLNIIIETKDNNNVYYDGTRLSPYQFSTVEGNPTYSFARIFDIANGVHHINCANGCNAHVYGFGNAKGYSYLVGSNASDLSMSLLINGEAISENEIVNYCIDQPITFSAEINYEQYELSWDFGDGSPTTSENPVTHTYTDKHIYNARLTVNNSGNACHSEEDETTSFFIDLQQHYMTYSDNVCQGGTYIGHGFEVLIKNDTILERRQEKPDNPDCFDSIMVYITSKPSYHRTFFDTECWNGQPGIYIGHGFSFPYDAPGNYYPELDTVSIYGCDSIITVNLQVTDVIRIDTTVTSCDTIFQWDKEHPFSESGDYEIPYIASQGCDSIIDLHLTMIGQNGLPDEFEIKPCNPHIETHWVTPATEFQINKYEFHINVDSSFEFLDSITWRLEPETAHWECTPYSGNAYGINDHCRLTVFNHVNDTVFLTATSHSHCISMTEQTSRFWMVCSAYGTEELTEESCFQVIPNPSNGEMNLVFENIAGKASLKVTDMTGLLIDLKELYLDDSQTKTPYSLNKYANGVYCFTLSFKGQTITRKVIIIR